MRVCACVWCQLSSKPSKSSHVSSHVSPAERAVLLLALRLASVLMEALPDVYRDLFLREGGLHHV